MFSIKGTLSSFIESLTEQNVNIQPTPAGVTSFIESLTEQNVNIQLYWKYFSECKHQDATYGYATVVACPGEQLVVSINKHDLSAEFSKINVHDFQSPTTRKKKEKKTRRLLQIFFHTVHEETLVCFRDFMACQGSE